MNGDKVSGITLRRELMALARQRHNREDRAADQITAFAGSLQFVYIHIVVHGVDHHQRHPLGVRPLPVRAADPHRLAGGDLPVYLRDDQPEP
ncbi:MAG TPA: hypothetical protein VHT94_15645 [Streptosporangiaceae bacterium]|nr:hypothetical protein [Streptosporangiaceae bacterium]